MKICKKILPILIVLFVCLTLFICGKTKIKNAETDPVNQKVVVEDEKDTIVSATPHSTTDVTTSPDMKQQPNQTPLPEKEKIADSEKPGKTEEPVEEVTQTVSTTVCTLSVTCYQIIENIEKLNKNKVDFVPENGILYGEKTVEFTEGESVFDILLREMRQNNIHLEFEKVPMYNSAYIEGIGNIYEFDCGTYSGWMYSVNGETPKIGSSQYIVKNGDKIEFFYNCNMLW